MGKVGLRYKCDLIEKIRTPYKYAEHPKIPESICSKSRLSSQELVKYIGLGGTGYGWHISELAIYAEPKALSEFEGLRKTKFGYEPIKITKPPQSWCYAEGR